MDQSCVDMGLQFLAYRRIASFAFWGPLVVDAYNYIPVMVIKLSRP